MKIFFIGLTTFAILLVTGCLAKEPPTQVVM